MKTETSDPIIALSADEYKRELSKTTVLFGFALDWCAFFENDFECDEDLTYVRMNSYVETMTYLQKHFELSPVTLPYRERMIRRVKERMAEIKI